MDLRDLRRGRADCPSELALDRYCAAALSATEQAELHAHLLACALCADLVAQRRAGFDAFPEVDEQAMLAAIQKRLKS